jgi:hypothetical protein
MADEKPTEKPAEKPPEKPADKKGKDRTSQSRQQQEKKRERDEAEFGRQLEDGSLVIRQMTPAERKANPPRERPPKKSRGRPTPQ